MKTPTFDKLMRAYFHSDWDAYHDTEDEVLVKFLALHSPPLLVDDITAILAAFETEDDLRHYTMDRDRPATGPNDGETYRAWLLRLRDRARSHEFPA